MCGWKSLAHGLQFGHACLRVETSFVGTGLSAGHSGFNSATPACAWRPNPALVANGPEEEASIRPRLLARGDAKGKPVRIRFEKASIRPRLLARGDPRTILRRFSATAKLQFGHACLRVETCRAIG